MFGDRPALAPKGRSRTVNKQLHISNGVQVGQWKLGPIWAVETGPNLGSGNWAQLGQWKLDPNWAVDIMLYTVWMFHEFPVIQVLRKIKSSETKSSILAHLEAMNFDLHELLRALYDCRPN